MVLPVFITEDRNFAPVSCKGNRLLNFHTIDADVIDIHSNVFNDATHLPTEGARVEHVYRRGLTHGSPYRLPFFKARYRSKKQVSNRISKNQDYPTTASILHLNMLTI